MTAIEQLQGEHQAVRTMLAIWRKIGGRIEKGEDVSASDLESLLGFIKGFVDRCHHQKEESYLFPALMMLDDRQIEEMVKTLTYEHARFHNLVQDLDRALTGYKKGDARAKQKFTESLRDYTAVLGNHEAQETNVLFEMAKGSLPEDVQEKLRKDFERVELEHTRAGRHEQFYKMLNHMQQSYKS